MQKNNTKKFNSFLSTPLQDCTLSDIPGVGQSSLAKLLKLHITSPEQLIGICLTVSCNPVRTKQWLMSTCAIRSQEAETMSEALCRKAQNSMVC